MKTISKLFFTAVLALAVTACSLGVDDTEIPVGRKHTAHFKVVTEESTTTKVYVGDALKPLWNAGDNITIFNNSTFNSLYQFAGGDGAESGYIGEVSTGSGDQLDNSVYAVYPYDSRMEITQHNTGYYDITAVLPAVQHYKANSFGVGDNTMLAVTGIDNDVLSFMNVCGYLKLRLYGGGQPISRIKIKGNNNEKIAGKAYIRMLNGHPDVDTNIDGATNEITLVCNPPVDLQGTTDFWFVIPPTDFTQGFTITVTAAVTGETNVKKTNNEIEITRNTLEWMSPLHVSFAGGEVPL